MQAHDFTDGNSRVRDAVRRVHSECAGKHFSDIVDEAGNQYVDFVMEGGGVLGIALTGYSYVLEQAGLRFLGIGGTSAGSINALVVAALAPRHEAKSEKLADILANIPMRDFLDGDADAQDFTRAMLEKASLLRLIKEGLFVIDSLSERLGLHPGARFEAWLTKVLADAGIHTTADLMARLDVPPPNGGLRLRDGTPLTLAADPGGDEQAKARTVSGRLALIAADVTTETKVDFPRMAKLYWSNWQDKNPAVYARASMSIPFFFEPFRSGLVPWDDSARNAWQTHAGYGSTPVETWPERCVFMDGGIISNFPINLFHQLNRVPRAPTFGAKIGFDRTPRRIANPASLLGAIFDSARHALDYDFVKTNPDYRKLVAFIDVESRHNWLDFNLSDNAKIDLFSCGAETAAEFLCGFDWDAYKTLRQHLAAAANANV